MALPYGATLALALINAKSLAVSRRAGLAPPVPAYPPGERQRKRRP